jgi:hypothetical protein
MKSCQTYRDSLSPIKRDPVAAACSGDTHKLSMRRRLNGETLQLPIVTLDLGGHLRFGTRDASGNPVLANAQQASGLGPTIMQQSYI